MAAPKQKPPLSTPSEVLETEPGVEPESNARETLPLLPSTPHETVVREPSTHWVSEGHTKIGEVEFGQRYRISNVLGHGGMGEVRVTRDMRIGREIAAKFLHASHGSHPEMRARFIREACLQGQLEHPSIVPVHDLGVAPDGRLFFTMKRVRGMTLQEVIDRLRHGDEQVRAKFSRRKLLTAFSNVCLSVAFAHEQGVIHRDLKPSNVMLGDFGETYVLDWGLAKIVEDPHAVPKPSEAGPRAGDSETEALIAGTPGYMAPEQIGGTPDTLTSRADVYALGAILFELLTLEPLHELGDRQSMIRSTMAGADARPSVRCPKADVPPELEAICVKATAFVPERRFDGVLEMHEAIERFLDGDRDHSLRFELASRLVNEAEESVRLASDAEGAEEETHRSSAIRAVGRALALDPSNARAMKTLVKLLLEPPKAMPGEAKAELARTHERTARGSERWGAIAFASCFLSLPMFLWLGVRDWLTIGVLYGCLGLVVLSHVLTARAKVRRRWYFHLRILLILATSTLTSRIFGPLILLPALLVGITMSFSLNGDRSFRPFTLFAGAIAGMVPLMLEIVGVLSPSYVFTDDGMMCVLPNATSLPPLPTLSVLAFTSVLVPMLAGRYAGKVRSALLAIEQRAHLYGWHLKQLVPREVRTNPKMRSD